MGATRSCGRIKTFWLRADSERHTLHNDGLLEPTVLLLTSLAFYLCSCSERLVAFRL